MEKVEEIMHTAGWFDASPDGPADVGDVIPVVPTQILSGSEWKAVVQSKRQEVLDERQKNLPVQREDFKTSNQHGKSANDVKIIDKVYLSKKFKAETVTEQYFIDVTVAKYQLNTE